MQQERHAKREACGEEATSMEAQLVPAAGVELGQASQASPSTGSTGRCTVLTIHKCWESTADLGVFFLLSGWEVRTRVGGSSRRG